jgi:hypothetical protein
MPRRVGRKGEVGLMVGSGFLCGRGGGWKMTSVADVTTVRLVGRIGLSGLPLIMFTVLRAELCLLWAIDSIRRLSRYWAARVRQYGLMLRELCFCIKPH